MLDKIIKYTIYTFTVLFPIFSLPITPESYEVNKMMLFIVTTLILLLLLSLKVMTDKKIVFIHSTFTIPFFFLALLTLISTLFQSSNTILALTTPLSSSTIITGFVFYLLLTQAFTFILNGVTESARSPQKRGPRMLGDFGAAERQDPLIIIMNLLTISAVIISFYVFAIYLGVIPATRFTPAGTLLSTAMYIAVIVNYLAFGLIKKQYLKEDFLLHLLTLILTASAMLILSFHLMTDQKPIILPFVYGWQIFVEILKNFRSFLLGIGPSSFVSIFTLARPVEINMTPYWNVIFTLSSSFLLTLATEVGVLAGALYLWILAKTVNTLRSNIKYQISKTQIKNQKYNTLILNAGDASEGIPNSAESRFNRDEHYLGKHERQDPQIIITLIVTLLLQLLLPGNMIIFILTILLMALSSDKRKIMQINLARFKIFNYLILLPVAAVILTISYFAGRFYLAEVLFKNSLDAIVNKSGTEAYNNQRNAISLNPYLDRYHLAFSQTNMALANALAGKNPLTEMDKQNIPRLIQQSTDYARSATTLNRTNAINWENLGGIYESIINFAEGADSWAIQSYRQKIILDPLNPQSHFKMGKLLYTLKKTSDAEIYLRQAIGLKQDYAAAHYLLGIVNSSEKKYEDAYRQLQTALAYLVPSSDDAKRVEKELSDLAKLIPVESTSSPQLKPELTSEPQTLENVEATAGTLQKLDQPLPTISVEQPPE